MTKYVVTVVVVIMLNVAAMAHTSYELKRQAIEMVHSNNEIRIQEGLEMMNEWSRIYNGYWSLQGGDGYQYYGTPKKAAYKSIKWRG